MELRSYLTVLRSRIWLILLTTVLAAAAAFSFAESPDRYVARATLFVGSTSVSFEDPEVSNDRYAALDRIALTYSKMIDTRTIASSALDLLDLQMDPDDVVEATETEPEPATQLVYIDVRDGDPEVAADLANALGDAFVDAVEVIEGPGEGAVPQLSAYLFQRAEPPDGPVPTNQIQSMILGGIFGLLVGAGIAFLIEYLDLSIRTAADAERHLELPVLGVIPSLGEDVPMGSMAAAGHGRSRSGS